MSAPEDEIGKALARIQGDAQHLAELARAKHSDGGDALAAAHRLRDLRVRRDETLPAALFGDPAWDMLLALFIAGEEKREITMTALFDAADVATATGTRWLDRLDAHGLVVKRAIEGDRRVRLYRFTEEGARAMRRLLGTL